MAEERALKWVSQVGGGEICAKQNKPKICHIVQVFPHGPDRVLPGLGCTPAAGDHLARIRKCSNDGLINNDEPNSCWQHRHLCSSRQLGMGLKNLKCHIVMELFEFKQHPSTVTLSYGRPLFTKFEYRVDYLLANLGCVDFDFCHLAHLLSSAASAKYHQPR